MVIPRSTYRLQLHEHFDFAAATEVLPYLAALGISHVYCSPIWRARPGSLHGYDVMDHARISDELGGEAGFRAFAAAAKARGLGLLLDIVPNHMGVFGQDNPWWLDVLENGQASEYADHFDIDWQPPNRNLHAKLLVPVLGDHYGNVLDAGGLQLHFDPAIGRISLDYSEHRFPLDPRTYPLALQGVPGLPEALLADFAALPSRDDPERRSERRTRQRELQAQLAEAALVPGATLSIEATLKALNDDPNRDALGHLHDAQAWRLAHWRVASGDINYRRFFDVNTLAAVRIEDEHVFEATQSLALSLAAEGVVDGLRVDHSDGLHDPAAYFERLQQGYARRVGELTGTAPDPATRPLYVLSEKIIGEGEDMPRDWALAGTTGYEFAVLLTGLFVERANEDRLSRLWHDFSDDRTSYAETARRCKQRVAKRALGAELTVLGNALQRIAYLDRRTRDYSIDDLREATADLAACLAVYRTYVAGSVSSQDVRFVDRAIALARRHTELADPTIFDLLRACLLTPAPPADSAPVEFLKHRFAMRFQQFSSPVAAKGVEDTAFYRYHRLISLNDVGGSPAVFGTSADQFHAANTARLARWPHTMLASSTHDNKRAEDVRFRLDVLSEQPAAFRLGLRRWKQAVEPLRVAVDGDHAPSNSDLYLLYQTLLGTLPAQGLAPGELAPYRERIQAYMLKAVREAKVDTGWDRPNPDYEKALADVIDRVLADGADNAALGDLQTRATELAWLGALNSASATVLKLSVPGMPDTYQGTELIDLSLVDPDNRRPVDYALRQALLDGFAHGADPRALAREAPDGRFKLWCLWRLLAARNAHPALFSTGSYTPLRVVGARRAHAIGFVRRTPDATLIVVVARKYAGLDMPAGTLPVGAAWADTHLRLPRGLLPAGEALDLLTDAPLPFAGDTLLLADVFKDLPVAALLIRHTP